MGVICILLGIITFLGFTGLGALAANELINYKMTLSVSLTALKDISNTSIMVGVICVCAFIGLLIGLNLIMHGLTYNKISKMYHMARKKAAKR